MILPSIGAHGSRDSKAFTATDFQATRPQGLAEDQARMCGEVRYPNPAFTEASCTAVAKHTSFLTPSAGAMSTHSTRRRARRSAYQIPLLHRSRIARDHSD